MQREIRLTPIGVVHSTRTEAGDDDWDRETAHVALDPSRFSDEALAGLAEFSHVEIIFHMNQVDPAKIEIAARHPRNNKAWPRVGIFAQRGKNRPNQLGATICRVLAVDGRRLHVGGLDAIDGTPVLDIKPWVAEFAPRGDLAQPQWITELMRGYWAS
jgi:tRNA-Thr(GGU) m(6)t(6)A37 methyltransferase TsaA